MPTWTNTTVDATLKAAQSQSYMGFRAIKVAGVIWTVYTSNTSSKIIVRSSATLGASWSAEEVVFTPTTPTGESQWNLTISADATGQIIVVAAIQDTAGKKIRVFRRESGSWVAKGTVTISDIQAASRLQIFQHPTVPASFIIFFARTTTTTSVTYFISTDTMATWSAEATIATNGNNSGVSSRGAFCYTMDSAGAIFGLMNLNNGADRMYSSAITSAWSGGTATITNTDISGSGFGGPWSSTQGPKAIWLARYANGDLECCYSVYVSGANNNQIVRIKRTSGTWGNKLQNPNTIGSWIPDLKIIIYSDESSWKIYSDSLNGGSFNVGSVHSHIYNGSAWVDTEFLDENKTHSCIGPMNDMVGQRMKAGDCVFYENDNDLDWKVFVSSDANFGEYQVLCTNTIRFFQTLARLGFVIRSIVSTAVTQIPGGGRQIVKTAAGVLWHTYYEGGSLKAAYSSDNGTSWTVTVIGPTWVPSGIAMCIGSGDVPVVAITRPSNDDFYIYAWNGTTWIFKKQISEPVRESQSFQILWTGATYMLVFGYLTSTSDRRVYSKTSADLVTWNTSVLMHNGDSGGTGPHQYRRVAACVDSAGNVHAAYSIRQSNTHTLYYRKYSSGAWGTEETIATGYGGNNVTDFHSALSIAVDDLNTVHLICRARGTTYTGRVRVVYFRRTTSWAAVENVHTDVDGDQDFPSLSLNLRTPVACWASQGLGLGVIRAVRGSDGTWAYDTITNNVRDSVQTVHGPGYGSSLNYTRGVVGSMRGSEEYFYSTDIISGNAASMETTINFTSILSTQRRVLANTINFSSVLSAVRSLTLRNTINFFSQLNFARQRDMANTITFTQHLEAGVNTQPISQTIHFTSSLAGVKSPIIDIHQTINFTSRLNRVVSATITNSIAFSGAVTVNIVKRQAISQTINFISRVTYNARLNKFMSSVLNFVVGLVAMKGDEGCQPAFTPERPLPASEDDVNVVYLIGPLPNLSLTVQLKRPEYGNTRRQALQVKVNRTRGGKLRPHARTPTYEPQSIMFESLSYLKLEQVRNFLRVCKGKKIYYIDEKNRKWIGYITTSDIDLAEEARDRGGQFTLDFEGVLAS